MKVIGTPLNGLRLVLTRPYRDPRGSFARLYCQETLAAYTNARPLEQINLSVTTAAGSIRGMHFQYPPYAEFKLVQCLAGRVYDVAIDLRHGSSSFMQWFATELSPDTGNALLIPPGFAHGFQTMTENCQMLYFHTESYHPESEGAIAYNDPKIDIHWPLPVTEVSDRDLQHPFTDNRFSGIKL